MHSPSRNSDEGQTALDPFERTLAEYQRTGMGKIAKEPPGTVIMRFDDIPDFVTFDVTPAEPVIDGLLYSGSMTLLAGADGTAKTFLAQVMALAVATGGKFLGRTCRKTPTLYLDFENPGYAVKDRMELLTGFPDEPQPIPNLKLWGTWFEHQPPQIGSDLLLEICREAKPLLIVDPLRYAHNGEENDSGEMMMVMRHLRSYASAGSTVLVIHHVAKAEGSTYRGSTALRGAFDVAYLQEQSEETGLLKIQCVKNRFGDKQTIHIRPDFDAGRFDVTDSPAWTKHHAELGKLRSIIEREPGISGNRIFEQAGGYRSRIRELLKSNSGKLWQAKPGPRKSMLYFPLGLPELVPVSPASPSDLAATGTVGLPLIGSPTQSQLAVTKTTGTKPEATKTRKTTVCPNCRELSVSHYSDGSARCENGCEQ